MQVRIRDPKWQHRTSWMFEFPEFIDYTGDEVPPRKWEANVVCMTTGIKDFPIRTIPREYIVSIDGIACSYEKPVAAVVKQFKVAGSKPGTEYTVTAAGGKYHCSCPGFVFRNTCKHVVTAAAVAA